MTSATLKKVTQTCQTNSLMTWVLILVVILLGNKDDLHPEIRLLPRDWNYLMVSLVVGILVFILRLLELLVEKDKIQISVIVNLYNCKKMKTVVELVTALLAVLTTLPFSATIVRLQLLDSLEWRLTDLERKVMIQSMILIVVIVSSNGQMVASIVRVWAKKFAGLVFIFGLVFGFAGFLYSILFVEAFVKMPGGAYWQSLHYFSIVCALAATLLRTVIYLHINEVVKIDILDRLQRIVAIVVLCVSAPALCCFFTIIEVNKMHEHIPEMLPWNVKYLMFVILVLHIVSTLSAVYGVVYPDSMKYKRKNQPASTVVSNPTQVQSVTA